MVAFLFVYYSMKAGTLKQIENTNRRFGEAEGYCLMYDSEGKGYIFTKEQLKYAGDRFTKHPEDVIPYTNDIDVTGLNFTLLLLIAGAILAAVLYYVNQVVA